MVVSHSLVTLIVPCGKNATITADRRKVGANSQSPKALASTSDVPRKQNHFLKIRLLVLPVWVFVLFFTPQL